MRVCILSTSPTERGLVLPPGEQKLGQGKQLTHTVKTPAKKAVNELSSIMNFSGWDQLQMSWFFITNGAIKAEDVHFEWN